MAATKAQCQHNELYTHKKSKKNIYNLQILYDPLPGSASSNITELLIRIIDEEGVVPQQLDLEMVALCQTPGDLLDLYLW